MRERMAQVLRTQQVAVFSLAKLAESRDTETGAHLERIRSYARLIGTELAQRGHYREMLTPDFIEEIYHSSPLHDIGKVGILDEILLKPGRLTTEEFEVMKTHTLIGGDTLRAADIEAGPESFLAMGRDIAYYHHERWDGNGYPFGRCRTEIPIEARIVAVSDVYDALSSKRPYKVAFTHEKSKGIIVEGRGTFFDPAIVDAFLACEDEVLKIHSRLEDNGMGHAYGTKAQ
ncbi:MAG: HD domain-containing protein [Candidatus Hydrogenedentes bacterium]|nr:HD domain-containing protein [Candidatus Hydrogenedentota bacterium]